MKKKIQINSGSAFEFHTRGDTPSIDCHFTYVQRRVSTSMALEMKESGAITASPPLRGTRVLLDPAAALLKRGSAVRWDDVLATPQSANRLQVQQVHTEGPPALFRWKSRALAELQVMQPASPRGASASTSSKFEFPLDPVFTLMAFQIATAVLIMYCVKLDPSVRNFMSM